MVYNFNAGPAVMPQEVLKEARDEFLDFNHTGMSILEISHRSKDFDKVMDEVIENVKTLLDLDDEYDVLFLQGGATTQFSMVPMNFLKPDTTANYIVTGSWSQKAKKEADKIGKTFSSFDDGENNFIRVPQTKDEIVISPNPAYVHLTSNNTIFGTEFREFPTFGDVPLIGDMSSDIMSHPFNAKDFSLIYAGAQKNLGPAGVTLVILKKSFAETAQKTVATMLDYSTHTAKKSMYNTPPVFGIYLVNLVCRHLLKNGGLAKAAEQNQAKAQMIYKTIDESQGFYIGHAEKDSRSYMNVTFNMASPELEAEFVAEATKAGLVGLKGHRSVGGLRASLYNAMTIEGVAALQEFMIKFQERRNLK